MASIADTGRDMDFRRRKGVVESNVEAITEYLTKKLINVLGLPKGSWMTKLTSNRSAEPVGCGGEGQAGVHILLVGRSSPSLSALLDPRNITACPGG